MKTNDQPVKVSVNSLMLEAVYMSVITLELVTTAPYLFLDTAAQLQ
jgi:hypothetical protein